MTRAQRQQFRTAINLVQDTRILVQEECERLEALGGARIAPSQVVNDCIRKTLARVPVIAETIDTRKQKPEPARFAAS
jgi:hypothetical protein